MSLPSGVALPYDTLVVDLEHQRPIAVLEGCTASNAGAGINQSRPKRDASRRPAWIRATSRRWVTPSAAAICWVVRNAGASLGVLIQRHSPDWRPRIVRHGFEM